MFSVEVDPDSFLGTPGQRHETVLALNRMTKMSCAFVVSVDLMLFSLKFISILVFSQMCVCVCVFRVVEKQQQTSIILFHLL